MSESTLICSMTGFAAATVELDTAALAIEIRSVNHRYLDIQIRAADELRIFEPALREAIAAKMSRGKIECRIHITQRNSTNRPARINLPLLHQLSQWSEEIRNILPAARDLDVTDILHWNGIFETDTSSTEKLHDSILDLLQQTLLQFNAARAREGEKLKEFLLLRVAQLEAIRAEVSPLIPAAIQSFESKLRARLLEALGNHDDERVRQEISLFAHRIDVDEELSRLQTHLTETSRILKNGGIVGKRLDFMMQELHREANTLGSKSADPEVSRASIEMKILIEQMREQIQNME